MYNPLFEAVNSKLIINRKKIINSLENKLDYHRSLVDMYKEKMSGADDPSVTKRAKVNIWRHNKEVKKLEDKLVQQNKILNKLTEGTVLAEDAVEPYNVSDQMTALKNPSTISAMSFSTVFKPFNILGLNIKTRNRIMAEANIKLSRVNKLTAELTKKAQNPQNKNSNIDQIKLKYCNMAYKLHHEFINKTLFWKSRSMIIMGPQFLQLKEQYTRALFALEQDYKREELGLNTVDTSAY